MPKRTPPRATSRRATFARPGAHRPPALLGGRGRLVPHSCPLSPHAFTRGSPAATPPATGMAHAAITAQIARVPAICGGSADEIARGADTARPHRLATAIGGENVHDRYNMPAAPRAPAPGGVPAPDRARAAARNASLLSVPRRGLRLQDQQTGGARLRRLLDARASRRRLRRRDPAEPAALPEGLPRRGRSRGARGRNRHRRGGPVGCHNRATAYSQQKYGFTWP